MAAELEEAQRRDEQSNQLMLDKQRELQLREHELEL